MRRGLDGEVMIAKLPPRPTLYFENRPFPPCGGRSGWGVWHSGMMLLLAWLFLAAMPALAQPLAIEGKIVNGTNQAEGRAETVTLLALGQGMQEISSLKNVQGGFKLPLNADQPGPFLLRATYQGVNYFKAIGPFQARQQSVHEIVVYDQVDNLDQAKVDLPHLFIKRDESRLLFAWNFEIQNPTSKTMHRPGGIFQIGIPEGAESLEVSASSGAMPVRASLTKDPASGYFFINHPVKPGKTSFQVSYSVDYGKENYTLEQKTLYPLGKTLALIYPEDMQVESEGLKEVQVDAANHVKVVAWESLAVGSLWKIRVSGGSKISAPPTEGQTDHDVVERPPAIAKAKGLIWGLMALGLGLNLFLFLKQTSSSPAPSFEFSALGAYREKLSRLSAQRAKGALDEKAFHREQQALVKEAWNAYLEETGAL